MKIKQTKHCIVCLSKATNWSGIVRRGSQDVCAGFCESHEKIIIPDLLGIPGCVGAYHASMGIISVNL